MHPRLKEVNDLISMIPKPTLPLNFKKDGKLVICLIEFRVMKEIEYVMNAVLRVYKPEEIGIAVVYGTRNASFVENTFKDWNNLIFVKTEHANLDRGTYSILLKQPQFYEHFLNFSHILIYQTDALTLKKIPEKYFQYDYIGAPWTLCNQCARYPAGNGGYSLRNIKSMIKVCEQYRNVPFSKGHRGNEDIFFCSQKDLKYPNFNSDAHKEFAIERVYHPNPTGCHQVHLTRMNTSEWSIFVKENIINNLIGNMDTDIAVQEATGLTEIKEKYRIGQKIGPYTLEFVRPDQNKWEIDCSQPYEILFCKTEDPLTCVKKHSIGRQHRAIVHKKGKGCFFFSDENHIYIGFKGFPNGGQSYADIMAPEGNSFGHARELPKNGIILLKTAIDGSKPTVEEVNERHYISQDMKISVPELVFVLFTGVGFYNQLFSLEMAVYLANISNRALRLYVQHPLVHCGQPNRAYGVLTDYLSDDFTKYLVNGFSVHKFESVPRCARIELEQKMSNVVFVDRELSSPKLSSDRRDFCHSRQELDCGILDKLFNPNIKRVKLEKSNASRCFTNIYTKKENYMLMSNICNILSKNIDTIEEIYKELTKKLGPYKHILAVHLRFGDYHKKVNSITGPNNEIERNITPWFNKYSKVLIMTDRKDNPFFQKFKNKVIFADELINNEHRQKLSKLFNKTDIAEFIVQKKLCEYADLFIGSQGSTVSTYIQYRNYINGKDHEKFTHMRCGYYNSDKLCLEKKKAGKYSWTSKNYLRGHPMAWSMFFEDNVHRKLFFSVDTWYSLADRVVEKRGEKLGDFKDKILLIKTDLILGYVNELKNITGKFVLITVSNDDHCIPYLNYPPSPPAEAIGKSLLEIPNMVKWFTKNACIVHPKIKPLPIGPKMQWYTTQFKGEDVTTHYRIFNEFCINPSERLYSGKENLLYINFAQTTGNSLYTPHKNIRHACLKQLALTGLNEKQPSANFEKYIELLSKYKFSVSPPGRGIDTHRSWESLLVGTIPIMLSTPIDSLFDDLPVVIVKSYKEVNKEFLEEKYKEILNKKNYNFEKLYRKYWIDEIKKDF